MAAPSLKQAFEKTGFEKAPPLKRIAHLPKFQYLPAFSQLEDSPENLRAFCRAMINGDMKQLLPADISGSTTPEKRELLELFATAFPDMLDELITACDSIADTYSRAYTEMSTLIGHALKFCVQTRMCKNGTTPEEALEPIIRLNNIASRDRYQNTLSPLIIEIQRAVQPEYRYLNALIPKSKAPSAP